MRSRSWGAGGAVVLLPQTSPFLRLSSFTPPGSAGAFLLLAASTLLPIGDALYPVCWGKQMVEGTENSPN